MGNPAYTRELEEYGGRIRRLDHERIKGRVYKITSATKEVSMLQAASVVFTQASLILAPRKAKEALVFAQNYPRRPQLQKSGIYNRPDLVVFFAPREVADRVARGENVFGSEEDDESLRIPSSHCLVSAVFVEKNAHPADNFYYEIEDETVGGAESSTRRNKIPSRCHRYLSWLSRHRPASCLQYGVIFNKDAFRLVSFGLDEQTTWREVPWKSKNCIQKLCSCVKLIRGEALRPLPPAAPKLATIHSLDGRPVGVYSAVVGGKQYRLLPLFAGSGDGRKPFVALAVAEDNREDVRVFKYSWCSKTRDCQEHAVLNKLGDVPGVVHVDQRLSGDNLDVDEMSGRSRSLLVLKTLGYPLSACRTVLGFLEAMYDLLEVLRYLVQEKKILHRDVSWTNVLINPVDHGKIDAKETGDGIVATPPKGYVDAQDNKAGDGIPHKYRFMSDIFNERRRRVRVALADFDRAHDLSGGNVDALKDATGTLMFMANDVLLPRGEDHMGRANPAFFIQTTTTESALEGCEGKYADESERVAWDDFYKDEFERLDWAMTSKSFQDAEIKQSFQHGAVHDAESVFYICILFFSRIWPLDEKIKAIERRELEIRRGKLFEKLLMKTPDSNVELRSILDALRDQWCPRLQPFFTMLRSIGDYLMVPWYNVVSTKRGERYEFHLHDFMQRLFLKEIKRMRGEGDRIELAEEPLSVRTCVHLSTSKFSDAIVSTKRRIESDDSEDARSEKRVKLATSHVKHVHVVCVNGKDTTLKGCNGIDPANTFSDGVAVLADHVRETVQFPQKFWEIYRWKLREKSWFSSNRLYD